MQLSAFHWDRADRLPEQTQRRVYGGAARAPRRGGGGIVKIFHWEGEPQRELDTATTTATTTSLRILQLIIRSTAFTTSGAPPFLPYGVQLQYTAPTRHGDRTNEPYTPREVCDEPLIPHPTRQPGLTARYSALLYTLIHLLLEVGNRGPRLGP